MIDISQQLHNNYYGLVWLQVATACDNPGDKDKLPTAIRDFIENKMAPPPDPANNGEPLKGYWSLDWGPGITSDNSNLSLLCSFRDQSGQPYFFVVGIRGTDVSVGHIPLIRQILQDFNVFHQLDWKHVLMGAPDPVVSNVPDGITAKVSTGTAFGFRRIARSKATYNGEDVTIVNALNDLLNTYPRTPVIVTGHSLGGCQTQVMAAYLAWQLCNTQSASVDGAIIPHAFAPSTAGDPDFATLYDTLFPYGGFWYNSLDLVPCGFTELKRIAALPPSCKPDLWTHYTWPPGSTYTFNGETFDVSNEPGPACPDLLVGAASLLVGANNLLGHPILPPYARPSNNQYELPGVMPTPNRLRQTMGLKDDQDPVSSDQVLIYHHFPQYYSQLVGATGGVAPYPFVIPPHNG